MLKWYSFRRHSRRDPTEQYCITCIYHILDAFFKTSDYTMSRDTKLLAAAFNLTNSSWGCAFSPRGHHSTVRSFQWQNRCNISQTLPASLLLNPDKSLKAFGYKAQEQYEHLKEEQRNAFYFFQEVTSVLDLQKVRITHTVKIHWISCFKDY